MSDLRLTVSRTIAAPARKVYDAWLNAETLARFMLPAEGVTVTDCTTDPRVGGRFSMIMRVGERDIPHAGTYHELTPHSRIRFGWESPFSADDSEVTIDLAPEATGTKVTLTHVRFPSDESRDNHEAGWGRILDVLGKLAA
ncbi:SRPBCC domain-containing protein [Frigidibacter sp. RF13]|uniref:SRPBCC family protein n=1 Tax=Frigidibacter sp. RF13 TaxID=2997340 RepID=UPI002271900D|nr:SRPBCC domain-containing protein [Frigidibacter sp. RF13]MCY1127364.1 SRPBCC domain-containing protein [Frigidibacter sp. RF13]